MPSAPQPTISTVLPARQVDVPPSQDLLGVPLALVDYASTLDWIDVAVERRHKGYV